jgi:hypothetical protein
MAKPIAPAKGIAFAFPDVCNTPSPGGPVPIPYPNIAKLDEANPISNTAGKALLVGSASDPVLLHNSVIPSSTGDEGGTAGGGVSSGTIKGPCTLSQASGSVFYGRNRLGLVRFLDQTEQNNRNATGMVLSAFPTVLVGD